MVRLLAGDCNLSGQNALAATERVVRATSTLPDAFQGLNRFHVRQPPTKLSEHVFCVHGTVAVEVPVGVTHEPRGMRADSHRALHDQTQLGPANSEAERVLACLCSRHRTLVRGTTTTVRCARPHAGIAADT